jgi:hypothetical protein
MRLFLLQLPDDGLDELGAFLVRLLGDGHGED